MSRIFITGDIHGDPSRLSNNNLSQLGIELDEEAIKDKIYDGKWTTPRIYFDDGSVADW